MKLNIKNIEVYILNGYQHKKGRSVETNFLHSSHKFCFAAFITWAMFHLVLFDESVVVNLILFNAILIVLILLTIYAVLIFLKRRINKNANDSLKKTYKANHAIIKAFSFTGASFGIIFSRIFLTFFSLETTTILISILFILLILTFVSCACVQYKKVYLIRKYCPRLKKNYYID